MTNRNYSILHITEAFASGTLEALRRVVSAQTAEGATVAVLHGVRSDSPPAGEWDDLFPLGVLRNEVQSKHRLLSLWSIGRAARHAIRQNPSLIVHVHSTYAAAVVRLFLAFQKENRRVIYSPHGFAFLRQDLARPVRKALLIVEKLLSHQCGGLLLVSDSEAQLVRGWVDPWRIAVVENAVNLAEMPSPALNEARDGGGHRPVVVTMGRVTYQKAPWRFASLAREFEDVARFVWIGDGASTDREKWLSGSPVFVTGWLPREQVVSQLNAADVFVLPSLWEGMPLALIEAQCAGLPAVASNIVGNKDVVTQDETGFLADDDDDLSRYVSTLISDPSLRKRMRVRAFEQRGRFAHERLGSETLEAYKRLLNRP